MKTHLGRICVLVVLFLWGCARVDTLDSTRSPRRKDAYDKIRVGDPVPDFCVTDLNGETFSGAEIKAGGRISVLVLFDATCGNCGKAMMDIDGACRECHGTPVTFLGISRGNNEADVKAMAEGLRLSFPVCPTRDKSVFESFAKYFYPRVYITDTVGTVRTIFIEDIPSADTLKGAIRNVLQ